MIDIYIYIYIYILYSTATFLFPWYKSKPIWISNSTERLRFLLVEIKIGISASRILNGASSSVDCNFDFYWVIDLH